MAAHSLRILMEMGGGAFTDENRKMWLTALGYAPGMDELNMEDWSKLKSALEGEKTCSLDFQDMVMEVLATQAQAWLQLGKPRTHSEWMNKKYSWMKEE